MNVSFIKNGQSRFVKHGYSWQAFFFGPITFLMRAQPLLAGLCFVALVGIYLLVGVLGIVVFDLEGEGALQLVGYLVACGLVGQYANRFSARAYVKAGWKPESKFPQDWNTPELIPTLKDVVQT